jgi:predicted transcriptional regulator
MIKMSQYRTQIRIIADVLSVTKDNQINDKVGVGITTLLRKSNIPHQRLIKLIKNLIESGLLAIITDKKSSKYIITDEGRKFLNEYTKFQDFALAFGLRI